MQFTTAALAALALVAPAMALPSGDATARATRPLSLDMTPSPTFNEAEVFSFVSPDSCSILGCINVIQQAVCIVEAVEDDNWQGIFTCANRRQLCNCSGCFSGLERFLTKHGIC